MFALALGWWCACSREQAWPSVAGTDAAAPLTAPGSSGAPAASVAPTPTVGLPSSPAASAAPSASAAPALPCAPADVVARDMGISFKLKSELSVVRVAPDDVLNLREGPGAGAKQVGVLPHDARAVRATGKVCRAGESTWFEVSRGSARGWANGAFLVPATPAKEVTPRVAKLLGPARFKSAEELTGALKRALEKEPTERQESPFEARLVGISRKGGLSAVFYVCCQADDSVMGEQLFLELADDAGTISLRHAHASTLCWRGTSTGGLCL